MTVSSRRIRSVGIIEQLAEEPTKCCDEETFILKHMFFNAEHFDVDEICSPLPSLVQEAVSNYCMLA
jgi:hypothetical protein